MTMTTGDRPIPNFPTEEDAPPLVRERVTRPLPSDVGAERALIGGVLVAGERARASVDVEPGDFFIPAHGHVWAAVDELYAAGVPIDLVTVESQLTLAGMLTAAGGAAALLDLHGACLQTDNVGAYADVVKRTARLRWALGSVKEAEAAIYRGDVSALAKAGTDIAERAVIRTRAVEPSPDLDDVLNSPAAEYRWLIPNLLERQDRVILTATEGAGKSTLLRQIGVQAASGIHPFTGDDVEPIKVMLLDLENSEMQVRRLIRPLRVQAGERYQPGQMRIEFRPQGVDLSSPADGAWLEECVAANAPDLLIGGPLYKMHRGDPNDEKHAKPVAEFLDHLRTTYDCALWLEAHVGHANGQSSKRPERPFGWSGWLRWPEFGVYLSEQGYLNHWRGARDADRPWPSALARGGEWPWTVETARGAVTFARVLELTAQAGRKLSVRDLAAAMGGDVSKSSVERAIKANRSQYDDLLASFGEAS